MSREQGPGASRDATARDWRQPPTVHTLEPAQWNGRGGMSRKQGPREAGMRPAAIAAGRRRCAGSKCDDGSEAVE